MVLTLDLRTKYPFALVDQTNVSFTFYIVVDTWPLVENILGEVLAICKAGEATKDLVNYGLETN